MRVYRRTDDLGVDCSLQERFEDLLWDHRTSKAPPNREPGNGDFGDLYCEYWKVRVPTRTVDLTICPSWVNKEAAAEHFDELWDWADGEVRKMAAIVAAAVAQLQAAGIPAARIEAPYCWQVFEYNCLLGLPVKYAECRPYAVFSPDQFGRFQLLKECQPTNESAGKGTHPSTRRAVQCRCPRCVEE
jgi:hypothetical protein